VSEQNKAVSRAIIDIFNGGDPARVGELIAENSVDHEGLPGLDSNGPQGFLRVVGAMRGAFPDLHAETLRVIAEGDMVALHFRMTGTHQGEFAGMPATGRRIDVMGVDLIRFENGKAVEHWGYSEAQKMMEQLGMMQGA
jgi:steroid delta-isomerase-like uncharacterized protein